VLHELALDSLSPNNKPDEHELAQDVHAIARDMEKIVDGFIQQTNKNVFKTSARHSPAIPPKKNRNT
jgi:hypothetical protein